MRANITSCTMLGALTLIVANAMRLENEMIGMKESEEDTLTDEKGLKD